MSELDRLKQYPATAKQRRFEWDFAKGAEKYEVWDEIEIGATGEGVQTFRIEEEDVVSFNTASLETDPAMVDADHARQSGGVIPHPLFVVSIAFYCIETGMGSWIRTPGASNPGQRIELFEPFKVGEEISARIRHKDKWIRRGRCYLEDQWDFYNEHGTLKATWHMRLLVPRSRDDITEFQAL